MCQRCYRYWLDHTPKEDRGVAPRFADDFWQQVEKTHDWGCWFWRGPSNHQGCGLWKNRHLAHREAWRREHGPIEGGLFVLHICDQKPCVNPRHLYLGTREQNAIDAFARGRLAVPRQMYCRKGHAKEGTNLIVVQSNGRVSHRCRQCENERKNNAQKAARRVRGLQKTRMTPEEKKLIWELCQSGMSQRRIAVEVGRSLWAVQQAITERRGDAAR
ncbi:HNH endonuclease signature motif containing protein [Streptomyces olivaceus]|uniref:HNH endonuclease signature motif containing protein n=1 Tax=Streptomyces olivaceus TaxID=47716 RepID=UPI0037B88FAF